MKTQTLELDPIQRASLRKTDGQREKCFLSALDTARRLTRIYDTRFGVRQEYVWNRTRSGCSLRYVATADIFSDNLISVVL